MKITLTPVFAVLIFTGATARSSAGETVPAKPPVAVVATSDAPFTLQGFFGKGDATEVSLRDPDTGRSVWLKRGAKLDGWKLESADSATGKVVISQGARKLTLRQAAEIPKPPVPEDDDEPKEVAPDKDWKPEDSAVMKRLEELMKDPKHAEVMETIGKGAEEALKKAHPEYFNDTGGLDEKKAGAIPAEAAEMKRLLSLQTSSEAEAMRPALNAVFDGAIQSSSTLQKMAADPDSKKNQMRVIFTTADRLYIERQGAPTAPAPKSK